MGYTASAIAARWRLLGGEVIGTHRDPHAGGVRFSETHPLEMPAFVGVTHLLISIPPHETLGDLMLHFHSEQLSKLEWIGYLSTTGVYGDYQGAWVDEDSPLKPNLPRLERRAQAEQAWLNFHAHVFRLAGIYGAGRSALDELLAGEARRIDKPGQVFSRIHVEDIAGVILASMARPQPGEIYNVCDDLAAPSAEVVAYAAELLRMPPPPLAPFEEAQLSPMARSFYEANRRVSNQKIKDRLGIRLQFPTYREGLRAIASGMGLA